VKLRRAPTGIRPARIPSASHGLARFGLVIALGAGACATVFVSASFSARPDAAANVAAAGFPGGRYFNVACGFSHRNNDDPIVFPGAPGRSHNHTYIGNTSVDASSTPASLRGGETTCDVAADASTYWTPTLYEGTEPLPPLAAILYYTRHTTSSIVSLPPGLKMVAGDPNAKRPQQRSVVSWSCGGGAAKRFVIVPQCSEESALVFNVRFPNCWNGRSTDSADHKRHMAYSAGGACPASHPVRVPTISLVMIYQSTTRHARLSSGKFGAHADFMNGWEDDVLARLVAVLN